MAHDTLERLTEIFRDVFDDDALVIDRATTAHDVEAWDSLMHVSLVVAVEEHFSCRFSSADVASLSNVGELVDLVDRWVDRRADRTTPG
jgi:acyl carrier protein